MQVRHGRVRSAPHIRAANACTICRRDTHVSALHCTCVRRVLRAMLATVARHARVHDVSTLHRTYVRRAPAASAAAPALRRPIPRRPASRLGHSAGAFGALHSRHARLGVRRVLRAMMLARMRVMAARSSVRVSSLRPFSPYTPRGTAGGRFRFGFAPRRMLRIAACQTDLARPTRC